MHRRFLVCLLFCSVICTSHARVLDSVVGAFPSPLNYINNYEKAGSMLENIEFDCDQRLGPLECDAANVYYLALEDQLEIILRGDNSLIYIEEPDQVNRWNLQYLTAGQFFPLPNLEGKNATEEITKLFSMRHRLVSTIRTEIDSLLEDPLAQSTPRIYLYEPYYSAHYYAHSSFGAAFMVFDRLRCAEFEFKICEMQKSRWGALVGKITIEKLEKIDDILFRFTASDDELSSEYLHRLAKVRELARINRTSLDSDFDKEKFGKILNDIAGEGQGGLSSQAQRNLAVAVIAYEELLNIESAKERLSVYSEDISESLIEEEYQSVEKVVERDLNNIVNAINNYALESDINEHF